MVRVAGGPKLTLPRISRRRGAGTLMVGLVLALLSVVLTAIVTFPTGLGVMLILALLYVAALSELALGLWLLVRGAGGTNDDRTSLSLRCLITYHRFEHVPARDDDPDVWRCWRCGKRTYSRPEAAGETIEAASAARLWVKRGDDM